MNATCLPKPAATPLNRVIWGALLLAGAVMPTASHAQNADLPYSSGSTGADGPLTIPAPGPARYYHALAYDVARQRTVLFGGLAGSNLNDTWEFDGTNWTQKAPATAPTARRSHAMAYDSTRQRVVLFGGLNNSSQRLNDTWEWDGTTWTQITPATSPAGRELHALAYDAARQRVVLFGGNTGSGRLSDTWEWDGTNWTQKSPAVSPQPRDQPAMAYDSTRQRVIIFGGVNSGGGLQSDTWEWDGTNWTQMTPNTAPGARYGHALAYDVTRQRVVLFGGYQTSPGQFVNDTWEWDGTNWTQKSPATAPIARYYHAMAYDSVRQRLVLFAGYISGGAYSDTWDWDGTNWVLKSGPVYEFDMTGRANGIWNFTSITVPGSVGVTFKKNAANTPVTWLATENVVIDGWVAVDGGPGLGTNVPELVGKGGPGGFDGGIGGTRFDISGLYAGMPGQGPGGGAAGTTNAQGGTDGTYRTTYGNAYLQPLIGGSGGGGGASYPAANGSSGGGGGGAILIASSKDITVNGAIYARGGYGFQGSPNNGGRGSGGAVRLVADRLLGAGPIYADSTGRIRLEGFYRQLAAAGHSTPPSGAAPTETFAAAANGQLIVSNVAGLPIAQPPTGSLLSPDVVFAQAGQITVTVAATNIPDGTPVTVRITTGAGVINLPATGTVTLSGGTATFNATVPAGLGTIQASAQYTVP